MLLITVLLLAFFIWEKPDVVKGYTCRVYQQEKT